MKTNKDPQRSLDWLKYMPVFVLLLTFTIIALTTKLSSFIDF